MRFEPDVLTLSSGESVLVAVTVGPLSPPGLAAFQLQVRFDPERVNVINPNEDFRSAGVSPFAPLGGNAAICSAVRGISPCPDPVWMLTSTGRMPFGRDSIDNDNGVVEVAYGTSGMMTPPTGSGTVALLEVVAKSAEPAVLALANVILAGSEEPPMRIPVHIGNASINGGVALPGDANCDGVLSVADVPTLVTLLHERGFGSCGFADANQDGRVAADDVAVLIGLLFDL
jgi:hypothetical protein